MDRRAFLLGAPALLAACSTKPRVFAPQEAVDAAYSANTGPTEISVFTVFNVGSNNGAHSALFIRSDQNILFDPAGTFEHETLPERHDVIYGMRREARRAYVDYHTRITYWSAMQTAQVSPATAAWLQREAEQAGPVPDALCARVLSGMLERAPGLPFQVKQTWFPNKIHDQLLGQPGITRQEFRQQDADDNSNFWDTATL